LSLRNRGLFVSGLRSYDGLLADPLISGWIDIYRSANTREAYLHWLNVLCARSELLPRQLLDLGPDEARRVVMNIVQGYLKQDKLMAAKQIQTAVKSFFEYHDRVIKFRRVDRIKRIRKKVAYEVIPSKDQIYRMTNVLNKGAFGADCQLLVSID